MEKGGFLPKKLVNIFRKAKHRMRPIQRGISNISKGDSVSKSDINTETSYIIAVTYKSGTKRVYNDVKIREYKKNLISFVYNKDYEAFKIRDNTSPKPRTIRDFANIKFYNTKKNKPISLSDISDIKLSSPKKTKSISMPKKSTSRTMSLQNKVTPYPAFNTSEGFLTKKGGKKK